MFIRYIKKVNTLLVCCLLTTSVYGGNVLTVSEKEGGFSLYAKGKMAVVSVSKQEPVAVQRVARLLADDIHRVTGVSPKLKAKPGGLSVVIGTIGHTPYIDKLIAKGKLDVSSIQGGWEQYVIKQIGDQLFIVGSDRRGTAYGVLALSEQMGVSPWYWWADMPVHHRNALYVTADYDSKAPTVKYRGLSIDGIGPRTYASVCELLLRLKANMLTPASDMNTFFSQEENRAVCDSFGIVVTTVSCEPQRQNDTIDIYEDGQRVPEDIVMTWVDDNYGYMKPVKEQHEDGTGVYYHLSYRGAPHDYYWLCTTPPVLMYEELKKAYDHGADRYWLLHAGSIKPKELGIQTFMDMAWNIDDFDFGKAYTHQARLLEKYFGIPNMQPLLDNYYRLAWSRKPEFMGWEYQYDDQAHTGLKDTEFSFRYYEEAQRRLRDYLQISDDAEVIARMIRSEAMKTAWFQMVQFPVQAAYQMNRKFLLAQLNHELTAAGRPAHANWAASQMEQAYDSINALCRRYNEVADGKWQGMMTLPSGYTDSCQFYQKPDVIYTDSVGEEPVVLRPLKYETRGCYVLNLSKYVSKSDDAQIVRGIGYDWQAMLLGKAVYQLPNIVTDSVDVLFYTVPLWPLYKGMSNRVEVSIDDGEPQCFENMSADYSRTWKDQVTRNGAPCRLRFAVDPEKTGHTITFEAKDPGQMLQRIIIDWGGLKPSYIGPEVGK